MHIDPIAYSRIVILTGAGISVASGLRTYRGPGGIWDGADLTQYCSLRVESCLHGNPATTASCA